MKTIRLVSLTILLAALSAAGQQGPRDGVVDAKGRAETVESLASTMRDGYVFADLGSKIADELRAKLKAGAYDSIASGRDFAARLTEDMAKLTKDAHLGVFYSADVLPARTEAATPSAEEEAAYKDQVRRSNANYVKVERLNGNIGYLEVTGFTGPEDAERPARSAMDFLANTDALILDLRRNGGGDPAGVQLLCSYLFAKRTHLNDLYWREGNRTEEFWTLDNVSGTRYLDKDVYVLISKRTGSGAEECAYNLKNLKRATLLGENTWGGANPGAVVRLNDHFRVFVPTGRAINPYSKTNWEGTGVDPDIRIDPAKGLEAAHKLAVEKLLDKAATEQDKERYQQVLKEIGQGS